MAQALIQAKQAEQESEVPVGAVIVQENQVIATGFNQTITHQSTLAHAELVALQIANQHFNNYRLPNCELFVTLEPCAMCSGALLHARFSRIVFGAYDPKTGSAGGVLSLFKETKLNHQTNIRGGVLEKECGLLLKTFFVARRKKTPYFLSSLDKHLQPK